MSIRLTLPCLLATLTGAAMAQDTTPNAATLTSGIKACMAAAGDPAVISAAFVAAGWTADANAEEGLIDFAAPAASDQSAFAFIADDGSFCHVESLTTGTAALADMLAATLKSEGWETAEPGKDDAGCTLLDLGDSITATLTSGGNDPTCLSDTDSAVRFEYGTEQ
jgi:hypothetical protein